MNYIKTIALGKTAFFQDVCQVLLGGLFLSLFASVYIPLPFTPVPIATQPHIALFLGAALGPRKGALAVFTFLVQGALGLPVFAGGVGGCAALLTAPRAGYLFGYMVAAYLVGWIWEKNRTSSKQLLGSLISGNLVIYLFGAGYLSLFLGVKSALLLGVLPFIFGDFLKIACIFKVLERFSPRR